MINDLLLIDSIYYFIFYMVNDNKLDENYIFTVNLMHMSSTCSEFSLDLTMLVDGMG